jgi:hypothetical protein
MEMVTKLPQITQKNFSCKLCDIMCSKKNDWERHILTKKHIGNSSGNKNSSNNIFTCEICNKIYKSRKGLWSHNKTCIIKSEDKDKDKDKVKDKVIELLIKENSEFKNIVLEIVKSNSELQKQLVDVCKNSNTTNIINNNSNSNNNSNNKTFNLNFFLNEECKDAMNISDFVNTFDLQLDDLESVGKLGYVEGITKQIIDKLNSMDIYKRPMHCSDAKRETIYIKDDNKWEKEERGTPKLRKVIKNLSFNNMKLIAKWSDTYPDSKSSESRLNDKYMKLVKQTTGGNGELSDNEDKIIRRIAKEIIIEK